MAGKNRLRHCCRLKKNCCAHQMDVLCTALNSFFYWVRINDPSEMQKWREMARCLTSIALHSHGRRTPRSGYRRCPNVVSAEQPGTNCRYVFAQKLHVCKATRCSASREEGWVGPAWIAPRCPVCLGRNDWLSCFAASLLRESLCFQELHVENNNITHAYMLPRKWHVKRQRRAC